MDKQQNSLSGRIPDVGRRLTRFSGKELIDRVGESAIKDVVTSILCGGNVRSLTEGLTQRRILLSNASLFLTYLEGIGLHDDFEHNIYPILKREIMEGGLQAEEKVFLQWLAGLTEKGFQNVLRSDPDAVEKHLKDLSARLVEVSGIASEEFGEMTASVRVNQNDYPLSWLSLLQIFYAVGTQSLAIRGSEKSMYGKLFEKFILGTLLTILGFKQIDPNQSSAAESVFWLSQRENKRESDATILVKPGVGARFDIGFIGPGNTEISLDKVSRFEREMEHGSHLHYLSTIILVDRIGQGSRIVEMAEEIGGSIVQMSMAFWVREVAEILHKTLGYKHRILDMPPERSLDFIEESMMDMDLRRFMSP